MVNSPKCCICGRETPSWNNPEPVRSPLEDCCPECNHFIVGAARRKGMTMTKEERVAYFQQLQGMPFQQLCQHFGVAEEGWERKAIIVPD